MFCLLFFLVCRHWREEASRKWKQITEIDNLKDCFVSQERLASTSELRRRKAITVISAKDAKKIVFNAAPYIKVLKAYNKEHKHFEFGHYLYQVKGRFDADTVLEFLILARATEVINVSFHFLPKVELMRLFLFNNKVKEFSYHYSVERHQQLPANGIEKLIVDFSRDYIAEPDRLPVKSFEGVCISDITLIQNV